jgi:hypothetical protein
MAQSWSFAITRFSAEEVHMREMDDVEQIIKISNLRDSDLANSLLQQIVMLTEEYRDELLWKLVWRLCEVDQIMIAERAVQGIQSADNAIDAELTIAQWLSKHGQCNEEMQAHLQRMRVKLKELKHAWQRADFLHHESLIWFECNEFQRGINTLTEAAGLSLESFHSLSRQNKSVSDALDSTEAIVITLTRKGAIDKARDVILKMPDASWQIRVAQKLKIDLASF